MLNSPRMVFGHTQGTELDILWLTCRRLFVYSAREKYASLRFGLW